MQHISKKYYFLPVFHVKHPWVLPDDCIEMVYVSDAPFQSWFESQEAHSYQNTTSSTVDVLAQTLVYYWSNRKWKYILATYLYCGHSLLWMNPVLITKLLKEIVSTITNCELTILYYGGRWRLNSGVYSLCFHCWWTHCWKQALRSGSP